MFAPGATVVGAAELVTAMSADAGVATSVFTVAVLLARLVSFTPELTESVSLMVVPLGRAGADLNDQREGREHARIVRRQSAGNISRGADGGRGAGPSGRRSQGNESCVGRNGFAENNIQRRLRAVVVHGLCVRDVAAGNDGVRRAGVRHDQVGDGALRTGTITGRLREAGSAEIGHDNSVAEARSCAIRIMNGRGGAVDSRQHASGRRCAGSQNDAATAAAAWSVTRAGIRRARSLGQPGIAAVATVGADSRAGKSAGKSEKFDGAARSAAAGAVVLNVWERFVRWP